MCNIIVEKLYDLNGSKKWSKKHKLSWPTIKQGSVIYISYINHRLCVETNNDLLVFYAKKVKIKIMYIKFLH